VVTNNFTSGKSVGIIIATWYARYVLKESRRRLAGLALAGQDPPRLFRGMGLLSGDGNGLDNRVYLVGLGGRRTGRFPGIDQ
jgi:hypothetical protein